MNHALFIFTLEANQWYVGPPISTTGGVDRILEGMFTLARRNGWQSGVLMRTPPSIWDHRICGLLQSAVKTGWAAFPIWRLLRYDVIVSHKESSEGSSDEPTHLDYYYTSTDSDFGNLPFLCEFFIFSLLAFVFLLLLKIKKIKRLKKCSCFFRKCSKF